MKMERYPVQYLLRPFFLLGMLVWFAAVYLAAPHLF